MLGIFSFIAALAASPAAPTPYPFDAAIYPHYELEASVDAQRQGIEVQGNVSVPASAVGPSGELRIALSERVERLAIAVVDERGTQSAVTATSVPDPAAPAELRRWRLSLPGQEARGGRLNLRFSYRLPGTNSAIFAVTPEIAFAGGVATAWYPQVVDQANTRSLALGEFSFRVPEGFIVVDAQRGAGGSFRVEFTQPTYFDFAAGPYREARSSNGRVYMYLLSPHPVAADFPERMDAAISALVNEFGPFPRERFSLVEVPTGVARATGFDGASLEGFILAIGPYFDQPFNAAFFGHELGHQWWGGLVRRQGASGAYLLDEALAQFGGLRAVEHIDGPAAGRRFRLEGYPGYYSEYSGFGFVSRSLEGIDAPLNNLPLEDGFRSRRVANTKGMFVWDMLAREFGRERFARFLAGFVAENAYKRVTLDQFLGALRQFAGDRAALVSQWFETTGIPDIRLSWQAERGGVRVNLEQSGRVFDLHVPLEIRLANGQVQRTSVHLTTAQHQQVLPVRARAVAVTLDPDYQILRRTEAFEERAQAIAAYTRGDIHFNYGRNDEARAAFEEALLALPENEERYALRFRLLRGLGDVAFAQENLDLAIAQYCAAARLTQRAEEQVPELWQGLSQAWYRKGDEARAAQAIEDAAASIRQLRGSRPDVRSSAERLGACQGIAPADTARHGAPAVSTSLSTVP